MSDQERNDSSSGAAPEAPPSSGPNGLDNAPARDAPAGNAPSGSASAEKRQPGEQEERAARAAATAASEENQEAEPEATSTERNEEGEEEASAPPVEEGEELARRQEKANKLFEQHVLAGPGPGEAAGENGPAAGMGEGGAEGEIKAESERWMGITGAFEETPFEKGSPEAHFLKSLQSLDPSDHRFDGRTIGKVHKLFQYSDNYALWDRLMEDLRRELEERWQEQSEVELEELPPSLMVERFEELTRMMVNTVRQVQQGALIMGRSQHEANEDARQAAARITALLETTEEIEGELTGLVERFEEGVTEGIENDLKGLVRTLGHELYEVREEERERINDNLELWREGTSDFREAARWIKKVVGRIEELVGRVERSVERFRNTGKGAVEKLREERTEMQEIFKEERQKIRTLMQARVARLGIAFSTGLAVALLFILWTWLAGGSLGLSAQEERQMQIGRRVQHVLHDSTITRQERKFLERRYTP